MPPIKKRPLWYPPPMQDDGHYSPPTPRPVAVAIKGGKGADGQPNAAPGKIIAAGRGALAEDILRLAFERGVPVREDSDLAELLVKLDLDTPIPSEAIVAVAEILAKVYEANARIAAAPQES